MSEKVLPKRSTRGKRLAELVGNNIKTELEHVPDDTEADEAFWNQEFFKEEDEDREFAEQNEEEDIPDSDFDIEESDEDDAAVEARQEKALRRKERQERQQEKRKKNVYVDPAKQKPKTPKQTGRKRKASEQAVEEQTDEKEEEQEEQDEVLIEEGQGENKEEEPPAKRQRKSSRESTKRKTEETQTKMQLDAATKKPKKKGKKVAKVKTQEERLREAEEVAKVNIASLQELLKFEEEKKKKVRDSSKKNKNSGPTVQFYSKNNENYIIYHDVKDIPWKNDWKPKQLPEKLVCIMTGKPAKYKDPLTGLPYYDIEAFKAIREKFNTFKASFGSHSQVLDNEVLKKKFNQTLLIGKTQVTPPQQINQALQAAKLQAQQQAQQQVPTHNSPTLKMQQPIAHQAIPQRTIQQHAPPQILSPQVHQLSQQLQHKQHIQHVQHPQFLPVPTRHEAVQRLPTQIPPQLPPQVPRQFQQFPSQVSSVLPPQLNPRPQSQQQFSLPPAQLLNQGVLPNFAQFSSLPPQLHKLPQFSSFVQPMNYQALPPNVSLQQLQAMAQGANIEQLLEKLKNNAQQK